MIIKTRMNNQHTNPKYTHQTYKGCFTHPPCLWQITANIRNCAVRNLCIQFSAYTQKPKCCYRYYKQQTTSSLWVSHSRLMPLPTTSFDYPEALLYPCSHSIPTSTGCRWWKVCKNKPRFFLSFFPKCKQGASNSFTFTLKGYTYSLPTSSRLFRKAFDCLENTTAFRTKRSIGIDTHEWMPFASDYSSAQFGRINSSGCHDDDKEISWDASSNQSQHTQPFFVPGFLLIAFGNSPCNRNSTTSIDNTDDQNSKRESQCGSIQCKSYLFRLPQTYYPSDQ